MAVSATSITNYNQYKNKGNIAGMGVKYYKEMTEMAASYNNRLCQERKMRMPFLDSQTGVAQNHSNLWIHKRYRSPGRTAGQIYLYPSKRWRKKKRVSPVTPEVEMTKASDIETGEADMHQISAVENPAAVSLKMDMSETACDTAAATAGQHVAPPGEQPIKEEYYEEWDDAMGSVPDAGEMDAQNSDSSDYVESYRKRRRRTKPKGPGRGRKAVAKEDKESMDEKDKPFSCDTCGARYKTRPGLGYHLAHAHQKQDSAAAVAEDEDEPPAPTPPPPSIPTRSASSTGKGIGRGSGGRTSANNYCDFCLGVEMDNKKTGEKEELFSCTDCGHSGHPSCLQFTPNMIISVQQYPWQCIECKSCGLCGTSDNDDQLLFCDDCDRGYHMYCLKPPLSSPPEGSWSCHLCVIAFHSGKKMI